MRIELIRRPERSRTLTFLSPVIAIALTVVAGFVIFAAIGVDPVQALYIYFIEPYFQYNHWLVTRYGTAEPNADGMNGKNVGVTTTVIR